MVPCFATMTIALVALQFNGRSISTVIFISSLLISFELFLFEIYNPYDGFRMPWLQG